MTSVGQEPSCPAAQGAACAALRQRALRLLRSSAFSFVSPTPSERFRGYDLRRAPFWLRPLAAWPEIDGEMLALPATLQCSATVC